VVQARCLGLVHLGFFVLAVDAVGAGERSPTMNAGFYHGGLYGSTLWPTGHTLLGMQVYDNERALDYLGTRTEVDAQRLGVTGASGGGNQTMYAGAMDERLQAVVPVCSVGTYQSYLHAVCCVCEVLPAALRFAEEGDVLALVAPRALMVVSATRDSFNFSVGEAARSVARARPVFELHNAADKLRHVPFESTHAYNQPMREAMYGWMTRWLKNEGPGQPIPEPKHQIEKPEDLACFPERKRPERFLLLPAFAGRAGRALVERAAGRRPDHAEAWESTALARRRQLRQILGPQPRSPEPAAKLGEPAVLDNRRTVSVLLHPEPSMPVPALLRSRTGDRAGREPACILLHLDGKEQALRQPLAAALLDRNWTLLAPDLRATGETRPANDAIAGAPDHNSAEHALWAGRPLLGQWVFDVSCLLDWLALQPGLERRRFAVVGLGQAGMVALCAGALLDDRVASAGAVGCPASYVTGEAYPQGTRMGLLAPGILQVGDVAHLAALSAPRQVLIAEALSAQGKPLPEKPLREAFAFARSIFRLYKMENRLTLQETLRLKEAAASL
jgi:pimeloyl-ACP methyl ester carboxylesterase